MAGLIDLLFGRRRPPLRRRVRRTTPPPATFVSSATLPFRGGSLRLERRPGSAAARLTGDGALTAGGDAAGFDRRISIWLRSRARERLLERTAVHAVALGVPTPTVTVNDARTRWGSCTPARGAVRYSWRLICAPDDVLDYVCAHEVAHLRECNHGPAFWALVRSLYGDPAPARRWLKAHGATLHAVGQGRRVSP